MSVKAAVASVMWLEKERKKSNIEEKDHGHETGIVDVDHDPDPDLGIVTDIIAGIDDQGHEIAIVIVGDPDPGIVAIDPPDVAGPEAGVEIVIIAPSRADLRMATLIKAQAIMSNNVPEQEHHQRQTTATTVKIMTIDRHVLFLDIYISTTFQEHRCILNPELLSFNTTTTTRSFLSFD
jgi:hypothetical protein